jgi:hypothetical protein
MWTPEGEDIGFATTAKGAPSQYSHQNLAATGNAIGAFRSGGDIPTISRMMGELHKVRNFYNDLVAPHGRWNDYTNDTHNIAASTLRPLAASDPMVGIGLGTQGPSTAFTGAHGLYGLYADAGREAARQVGMSDPSGFQSVVWEQVRSMFPKGMKTEANKNVVNDIWEGYRAGALTEDEARSAILDFARRKGGGAPPVWMGR